MKSIVVDFQVPISGGSDEDSNNSLLELAAEMQSMLVECYDLSKTLYIYEYLTSEEYCANTLLYNDYYETVKNSMVYRIVLGFSRLFDTHKDTRTLLKIVNCIEQNKDLNIKNEIKLLIEDLRSIDNMAKITFDFKTARDQYFAHLDKKKVFTSLSVVKDIKYIDELMQLLDNMIDKLVSIYEIGFEEVPFTPICKEIDVPDIRELKNFKQRAENYLKEYPFINKWIILTEFGLKFRDRESTVDNI